MVVTYWKGGNVVSPPEKKAEKPVITASGKLHRGLLPRTSFFHAQVGILKEGEVLHHVNNEVTMPLPKDVHQKFSGYSRNKHRRLIFLWCTMNSPYYLWLHKEANKMRGNRKWVEKHNE